VGNFAAIERGACAGAPHARVHDQCGEALKPCAGDRSGIRHMPARKGFGTTLIERELKQIGDNAKFGYKDSGFGATLSIPFDPKLTSLVPGAKPSRLSPPRRRYGECVMRYYFHLRIGRELSPDEIGLDLPDLDTAYLEAFQAARAMWSELLAERSDPLLRSFEIADSDGRVLLLLPFREVLESARKPRGRMLNEV
jgi:hypothetical protein